MTTIIRAGEIPPTASGTIRFEGEAYGSAVSLFLNNVAPGAGPVLHRHPYPETWIVRSGKALFTAGDRQIEGGPGDIVVVDAGTPHKYKNIGDGRLENLHPPLAPDHPGRPGITAQPGHCGSHRPGSSRKAAIRSRRACWGMREIH